MPDTTTDGAGRPGTLFPGRGDREVAGEEPSWNLLQDQAVGCTRCRLHEARSHVVFGEGDCDADLVFIGAAPGLHEDLQGKPFVGAAGNLLTNLLFENRLQRSDVYVCNVVKCRSPGGREPLLDEVEACSRFLRKQLLLLSPRVIVTLGGVATGLMLGRTVAIDKVAGYRFQTHGATLIPTYHPDLAVRGSLQAMGALRRDVRVAKGVLDGRIATAYEALTELRAGQTATET
ncbi:MAG: uracil-DNA glycosylase [Actinomycetota bacterium]|nr:uracil-DNA glycosylase [Actinomycetota bacterium]